MTRLAGGLALLACLGLAACGVGGSSSATTKATATPVVPTATPTLPAGFKIVTSSDGAFQIAAPTSWKNQTTSGVLMFFAPTGDGDLLIASEQGTLSTAQIATNITAFFKNVATSSGGSGAYTVTAGPTQVTIAGEKWTREEAESSASSGATLHSVTLIANHGQHTYIIGFAAQKSAYTTYDAQDFEPMVQSFDFLK